MFIKMTIVTNNVSAFSLFDEEFVLDMRSRTLVADDIVNLMIGPVDRLINDTSISASQYRTTNVPAGSALGYTYYQTDTSEGGFTMKIRMLLATSPKFHTTGVNRGRISLVSSNGTTLFVKLTFDDSYALISNVDTIIVLYGLNLNQYYSLVYSTGTVFSLADPKVNKYWAIENHPDNATSNGNMFYNFDILNHMLKKAEPEEYEGGFLFRILAKSATPFPTTSATSDMAVIAVYNIDTSSQHYFYPNGTMPPQSDTIHPLMRSLTTGMSGVNGFTGLTKNNFLRFPNTMTVAQIYEFTGLTSFAIPGDIEYFFEKPKNTLFPESYPNNASKLQTIAIPTRFYGFKSYDAYLISMSNATIDKDITTNTTSFTLSVYDGDDFNVKVNGVDIGQILTTITINVVVIGTTPTVINQTYKRATIILPSPLNIITITHTSGKETTFTIRVVLDGSAPTAQDYYYDGVFYSSDPLTTQFNEQFLSYIDGTATSNYIDAYGNLITPATPRVGTIMNGPHVEYMNMKGDDVVYYGITQGFWQPPNPPITGVIEFGQDGYIRTNKAVGTYTIFPITQRGHITLILDAKPVPIEISFFTLKGAPIDLGVPLYLNNHTTSFTLPGGATLQNSILTTSKSIKFGVLNFVFNINVIEKPLAVPYKIKVKSGQAYNLATLVGLDPRIDIELFYPTGGLGTNYAYAWTTPGDVSLGYAGGANLVVATIEPVVFTIVPSPIFARVGESFNIWDHISPKFVGSILLGASNNIDTRSDGTITINNGSILSLTVDIIILGVQTTETFVVNMITANATNVFITRDYTKVFTGLSTLNVITSQGNTQSVVNGVPSSTVDASFVYDSSPATSVSNVVNQFVIRTTTTEFNMVPFQTLPATKQYAIKDDLGMVTITMPHGPLYQIYAGLLLITQFHGGSHTFDPQGNSDLDMKISEYNDGALVIPIKIVSGSKKKFFVVQSRVIQGVSVVSIKPNFITIVGADIRVDKPANTSELDTVIVKETASGLYVIYTFEFLPQVQKVQSILYTPGQNYADALPSYGYEYPLIVITAPIVAPVSVAFKYGEINGTIKLIKYTGTNTVVQPIYFTYTLIGASEIYPVNVSASNFEGTTPISLPYINKGISFVPSGADIIVTKSDKDIQVGEWFINFSGETKLYQFVNLPPFTHKDVYIYDIPSVIPSWISDVPNPGFTIPGYNGGLPYINGSSFTFQGADTQVIATVDYFGTPITFNIIFEGAANITPYNVVQNKIITSLPPLLTGYTTSAPDFIAYSGTAKFSTSNATISINAGSMQITNNGLANGTTSTFYLKSATQTYIYSVKTHSIPYTGTVNIEIFNTIAGVFPYIFVPSDPAIVITAPTMNAVGLYPITYTYYDYTGAFSLNLSVIKVPSILDTYRIISTKEVLRFNYLLDAFGASSDYRLDGLSQTTTVGVGSLTTSFDSGGNVVLSTVSPNTTIKVIFTVSYSPSKDPNSPLNNTIIYGTIYFQSYDPTNLTQIIFNTFSGQTVATTSITAPGITSQSKVSYVEYEGNKLEGTNNNGLDWADFPNVKLSSTTPLVNNYFFYVQSNTSAEVLLITTVVLPANPTMVVKKAQSAPSAIRVDLLELFFPTLKSALIDSNLHLNGAIDYTNFLLSGFSFAPGTDLAIPYIADGVTLSTLTVNQLLVPAPVDPGVLAFTIPINVLFNLKTQDINVKYGDPNSQYSMVLDTATNSGLNVTNAIDGINVEFNVAATYPINVILFNAGVSSLSKVITFTAYDPKTTQSFDVITYSGSISQVFESAIISYSVDGVSYGTNSTKYLTIDTLVGGTPDAPKVTMMGTQANPDHVFIFTMKLRFLDAFDNIQKNIKIYNFTNVVLKSNGVKLYVVKGASLSISAQQISDAGLNSQISFTTFGFTPHGSGWEFPNDAGTIVGYVALAGLSSTITVSGNEPGEWHNFVANVVSSNTITNGLVTTTSGSGTAIIPVYIETLSSLVIRDLPIFTLEINAPFVVDLGLYVVNHAPVNFVGWLMNGSAIPIYIDSDLLSSGTISGAIATAGKYTFTGSVFDQHIPSLITPFSVQLVLYDPNNSTSRQVFVQGLQSSTITLLASVVKINDVLVSGSNLTVNNFLFSFSGNDLIVSALILALPDIIFTLTLSDGSRVLLNVSQFSANKDIVIDTVQYTGTVFKTNVGNVVVSYTILGSPIVYSPGQQYALPNTGTALINADGTFNIDSPTALTFIVSYAGSSTGSMKIIIQSGLPTVIQVEQPTTIVPIAVGSNIVIIQGFQLTQNTPYTGLPYARFTWLGTTLRVDNISSAFSDTILQVETEGTNINANTMLLRLSKGIDVIDLDVPINSTTSFLIPFQPIAVSYGIINVKGSSLSGDMTVSSNSLGTFTFDGQLLTITTYSTAGFSKPFGFTNQNGDTAYYLVKINAGIIPVSILPNQTISYSSNVAVVGDANSQVFPSMILSPILSGNVKAFLSSIQVLNISLSESYSFYVSLVDGSLFLYTVDFRNIDVYTSSPMKFSSLAILMDNVSMTFLEPTVSVVLGNVLNPLGLGSLTLLTPFNAKITIHII
jgi:hypothetical protein